MDSGTSFVKYILFLFNILCLICGIILISFGVLLKDSIGDVSHSVDTGSQAIPVALIVFGGIILVISFFGCCGAIRESSCMLMTYAFFLLILLVVHMILLAAIWLHKDGFLESMGGVIDEVWQERKHDVNAMDAFQVGFQCCGRNGPFDYGLSIPTTCCKDNSCSNPLNLYMTGCRSAFIKFWDGHSDTAQYIELAIVAIKVLGFVFACCLANNMRSNRRRRMRY